MLIAIASQGEKISQHFGHCKGFTLYKQEGEQLLKEQFVPNPGHRPGFLPVFLHDLNVDVIIAGGMGASAQQLFKQHGIQVIVGAEGTVDDTIEKYAQGMLQSTEVFCVDHHAHGEHDDGHCQHE